MASTPSLPASICILHPVLNAQSMADGHETWLAAAASRDVTWCKRWWSRAALVWVTRLIRVFRLVHPWRGLASNQPRHASATCDPRRLSNLESALHPASTSSALLPRHPRLSALRHTLRAGVAVQHVVWRPHTANSGGSPSPSARSTAARWSMSSVTNPASSALAARQSSNHDHTFQCSLGSQETARDIKFGGRRSGSPALRFRGRWTLARACTVVDPATPPRAPVSSPVRRPLRHAPSIWEDREIGSGRTALCGAMAAHTRCRASDRPASSPHP